nr:condensation domain-containing protein [Fodinicola feengrottensis]
MHEPDAVHQMSLEAKRELLAQLLKAEAAKDADQLSVAQRRYWVLRQMAPEVATHVVTTTELSGVVDSALLQQACAAVVRRRSDLSVGFVEVEGRPVRVHASIAGWVPLSTVDLSDVAAGRQLEQLRQVVAEEAARPFDAASPPLVRLTLVRCSPRLHVLVLVAHQLVADDRSGQLLVDEIRRAYGTLAQDGGVPDSRPAPVFADFATWQRTWLTSEEGARQLEWWRGRLGRGAGADAAHRPLSADREGAGPAWFPGRDAGTCGDLGGPEVAGHRARPAGAGHCAGRLGSAARALLRPARLRDRLADRWPAAGRMGVDGRSLPADLAGALRVARRPPFR